MTFLGLSGVCRGWLALKLQAQKADLRRFLFAQRVNSRHVIFKKHFLRSRLERTVLAKSSP